MKTIGRLMHNLDLGVVGIDVENSSIIRPEISSLTSKVLAHIRCIVRLNLIAFWLIQQFAGFEEG